MSNRKITRSVLLILLLASVLVYGPWISKAQAWQWPWQEKYNALEKESTQREIELKSELKSANKRYAEVIQKNLEIRKELESYGDKYNSLETERNNILIRLKELEKELEKEKENSANAYRQFNERPAALSKLDTKAWELNKKLDGITKDRDRLQKELDKEIDTVNKKLAGLDKTIAEKVQKEVSKVREKLEGKLKETEKNLQGSMDSNKKLVAANKKLEDKLKATEKSLQESIDSNKKLISERQKFLDSARDLEVDKQRLKTETKLAMHAQKEAERQKQSAEKRPKELQKQIDKERLDMHYNLAVVFDRNKMYLDAEREYLKCLQINPEDAGVHYNLGILYDDKLNDNAKAMKHYKQFLELRPMGEDAEQVKQWMLNIEAENRMGKEAR